MIHRVKKGETLTAIANKYGVPLASILKANSAIIKDANLIQVGWEIKIPTPATGETFQQVFNKVLNDIESLPSFKKFMEML